MKNFSRAALAVPVATAVVLSGCGQQEAGDSEPPAATEAEAVQVAAAFYPLEFVSEAVGGQRVEVTNLTRPGAEPHDLELAPSDVALLSEADLVVYLSEFQPAVDDAVESQSVPAFDVAEAADLSLTTTDDGHGHGEEDPHAGEDEHGHGEEDPHAGEDEHGHGEEDPHAGEGATDPHFWLDPLRLAAVGDAVAEQLTEVDPDGAETYADNAAALREQLTELDEELSTGLANCQSTDMVTSHNAFGYLADRYGFRQVGISGLSPEDEPSPAQLAEVTDFVRENNVSTIYFETLVSPDIARTVAEETGAQTATLDTLEGLTDESPGGDYVEVMRANLETLRQGQSCT